MRYATTLLAITRDALSWAHALATDHPEGMGAGTGVGVDETEEDEELVGTVGVPQSVPRPHSERLSVAYLAQRGGKQLTTWNNTGTAS